MYNGLCITFKDIVSSHLNEDKFAVSLSYNIDITLSLHARAATGAQLFIIHAEKSSYIYIT